MIVSFIKEYGIRDRDTKEPVDFFCGPYIGSGCSTNVLISDTTSDHICRYILDAFIEVQGKYPDRNFEIYVAYTREVRNGIMTRHEGDIKLQQQGAKE